MTQSSNPPPALERREEELEKLFSPSAGRNREAIAATLVPRLKSGARVLEIGSGTGEHAATVLSQRPDLFWQPSDPDARSRRSQAAWGAGFDGRMAEPLDLDLRQADWAAELGGFDALVSCNVVHISPLIVLERIAAQAGSLLRPGGFVFLYGPFLEGEATAPSNLDFDRSLKQRDPEWGVRSLEMVSRMLREGGFAALTRIEMPANNLSLFFDREESSDASS